MIISRYFFLFLISLTISVFAQENTRNSFPSADEKSKYIEYGPAIESDNTINESFEDATFPPAGWTKINVIAGSTGWERIQSGITPIPGWNGGLVHPAPDPESGTFMAYMNYTLGGASSNDNWLVTPLIENIQSGDSLSFWLRSFSELYADYVDVKISTTVNNDPSAFSVTIANITLTATAADTGWKFYSYDLASLVPAGSDIYIGFREHVVNNLSEGNAIFLDVVKAGGDPVPVELASFTASVGNGEVNLNWSTASEINNQGLEVQRASDGNNFVTVGFVNGFGTTTETKNYSFTDKSLPEGSYTYRLKQIDFDGTFEYSNEIEVEFVVLPDFALNQNYPNPFNPATTINFSLASDSKVTLKIFDVLGQEVSTLVNGTLNAGVHNLNFDASSLNSGIYFYTIEAAGVDGTNFTSTMKMMLTK